MAFSVGSACEVLDAQLGVYRPATVLALASTPEGGYYVHLAGEDRRLDSWVPSGAVRAPAPTPSPSAHASTSTSTSTSTSAAPADQAPRPASAPAPAPASRRKRRSSDAKMRNIDRVFYGAHEIKTWYYSPYPLEEDGSSSGSTRQLWICEGCLKYMRSYSSYALHRKSCACRHPPGRKVYQRGAHIVWEVDGAQHKLYCQLLCLLGKLFIDHKTIYYDVGPFLFYVLTDALNASTDLALGFFSKEKQSYDGYNLACILTLPPYQRNSFGTLMMELSYLLAPGTPERPLSDLGLRGYLSFWCSRVLRTLDHALADHGPPGAQARAALLGSGLETHPPPHPEADAGQTSPKRHALKGWAGEAHRRPLPAHVPTDHPPQPTITTTLDALARATRLRAEDVALALHECGLLTHSHPAPDHSAVLISHDAVKHAIATRRIRPPVLDQAFILI